MVQTMFYVCFSTVSSGQEFQTVQEYSLKKNCYKKEQYLKRWKLTFLEPSSATPFFFFFFE